MPKNNGSYVQVGGRATRPVHELQEIAHTKLERAALRGDTIDFERVVRSFGDSLTEEEIAAYRAKCGEVSADQVALRDALQQRRRVMFLRDKILGEWDEMAKAAAEQEARRRLGLTDDGGGEAGE